MTNIRDVSGVTVPGQRREVMFYSESAMRQGCVAPQRHKTRFSFVRFLPII